MLRAPFRLRLVLPLGLLSAACLADNPDVSLETSESSDGTSDGTSDETSDETSDDMGETARTWRPMVSHDVWQPDTAPSDPRPEHRPASVECEQGWYLENGGIEIDTDTTGTDEPVLPGWGTKNEMCLMGMYVVP